MCIQGMHQGLQYILQCIKSKTFEELATRAHDMELSMAAVGSEGSSIHEPCKGKDKQDIKKVRKVLPNAENKESMNVNTSPVKFTTKVSKKQSVKMTSLVDKANRKLTLKEMQEK